MSVDDVKKMADAICMFACEYGEENKFSTESLVPSLIMAGAAAAFATKKPDVDVSELKKSLISAASKAADIIEDAWRKL